MRLSLSTLLAAVLLLCLTGCSAGVGQQLLVERDAFNGTLLAIHTAHLTGVLSPADEAKLLPVVQSVQAALDAADAAYKSNDVQGARVYLEAISAGLAKLAELYPPLKAPTTQPARTTSRTLPARPEAVGWFKLARQPGHSYEAEPCAMPNAILYRCALLAV